MKILLKLLFALVLVIALVVGIGIFYLDSGIKKAVETFGPQYTQTDVSLGRANLSPWSGKGSLHNLLVANPEGFTAAHAFSLGEISVEVDTDTLGSDPIVISSLRIIAPEITFEQGKSGSNLQRLQRNVEQSIGSSGSSSRSDAEDEGEAVQVIIKDLLISGGQVHYSNVLLGGKTIDLPLPDIHLTGIGEKSNGASAAEVAEQVLATINKNALSAVSQSGALKDLGKQVEQNLKEKKGKLEESLGGLKGLLGK